MSTSVNGALNQIGTTTAPFTLNPNAALASDQAKAADQKTMFLKLLVAQMKNQDPSSPMDQKDMMGQMAQFTSVEQLTNMTTALTTMQTNATFAQSVSMIGKSVDFLDAKGDTVTGQTVTGVTSGGGVIKMVLENGTSISPADIIRVGAAAPAPTTAAGSTTAGP